MDDDTDDTKRRSRNLSEKKRRDQFNSLVNELSTIISENGRKMDKSTVLKSTIAFLRSHNESTVRSRMHDIQEEWKPTFLSNEEFTHLILDALDSFIIVFSATGHIKFVSDGVTSLLGHVSADMLNKSIFDLAYDEDRPSLYNLLQNPGISVDALQAVVLKENQIKFLCHIRRGTYDSKEEPAYELVQFIGYFRTMDTMNEAADDSPLLFVCTGRLQLPQLIRDLSPITTEHCEFTSRHSLEWKYLFLDHRAPSIIGYLPFEVLGTSGYDYYHLDDLEKVASCHEALMEKGELTSCYYRFLTKGQQWIWLQTRFYITYHQWNSKPEFVVCSHRVVSYADELVKSEGGGGKEEAPTTVYTQMDDIVTEADVSMGDVSVSYVSESSDDYEQHRKPRTDSVRSMSTGSGAEGSLGPSSSKTVKTVNLTNSAPSSTPSIAEYDGAQWSRASRMRYASSEFGSASSSSVVSARRRPPHDPSRSSHSELSTEVVSSHYLNLPQYTVPVPVVATPVQVQLQRKHEELQQMIVMQQEELRRIAEQLVMARLGLLPPALNYPENVVLNGGPPQIMYEMPPAQLEALAPQSPLRITLPTLMPAQSISPSLICPTPVPSTARSLTQISLLQAVPNQRFANVSPQMLPQIQPAHLPPQAQSVAFEPVAGPSRASAAPQGLTDDEADKAYPGVNMHYLF